MHERHFIGMSFSVRSRQLKTTQKVLQQKRTLFQFKCNCQHVVFIFFFLSHEKKNNESKQSQNISWLSRHIIYLNFAPKPGQNRSEKSDVWQLNFMLERLYIDTDREHILIFLAHCYYYGEHLQHWLLSNRHKIRYKWQNVCECVFISFEILWDCDSFEHRYIILMIYACAY